MNSYLRSPPPGTMKKRVTFAMILSLAFAFVVLINLHTSKSISSSEETLYLQSSLKTPHMMANSFEVSLELSLPSTHIIKSSEYKLLTVKLSSLDKPIEIIAFCKNVVCSSIEVVLEKSKSAISRLPLENIVQQDHFSAKILSSNSRLFLCVSDRCSQVITKELAHSLSVNSVVFDTETVTIQSLSLKNNNPRGEEEKEIKCSVFRGTDNRIEKFKCTPEIQPSMITVHSTSINIALKDERKSLNSDTENGLKRKLTEEEDEDQIYKFTTCPVGQYWVNNGCTSCHSYCQICYDEGPTNCLRCINDTNFDDFTNSCLTEREWYLNEFLYIVIRVAAIVLFVCGCIFIFFRKGVDMFWRLLANLQMFSALVLIHSNKTPYLKTTFEGLRVAQLDFFPNFFRMVFFWHVGGKPYTVKDDKIVPTMDGETAPPNFLLEWYSSNFIISGGSQIWLMLFLLALYWGVKMIPKYTRYSAQWLIDRFEYSVFIRFMDAILLKTMIGVLLQITQSSFSNVINAIATLFSIVAFIAILIFETWMMSLLLHDDKLLETDEFRTKYGVVYQSTERDNFSSRYIMMLEQLRRFIIASIVVTMQFNSDLQFLALIAVHTVFLVDHVKNVHFKEKAFQRKYIIDDFFLIVITALTWAMDLWDQDSSLNVLLSWIIIGIIMLMMASTILYIFKVNAASAMIMVLKIFRALTRMIPRLGSDKQDRMIQSSLDIYFAKENEEADPNRVVGSNPNGVTDLITRNSTRRNATLATNEEAYKTRRRFATIHKAHAMEVQLGVEGILSPKGSTIEMKFPTD